MDRETLVDRLNDLLELEMHGLPWRLSECQSFIDWSDARVAAIFAQIVADGQDHPRWLIDDILRLGGAPRTVTPDIRLAGLHYVEARHLLPMLVEEKRRLVDACQKAVGELPTTSAAIDSIMTILSRHQAHLEQLEALAEQLTASAAQPAAAASQGHDA